MAASFASLVTWQTVFSGNNPEGQHALRASRCCAPLVGNNQTARLAPCATAQVSVRRTYEISVNRS